MFIIIFLHSVFPYIKKLANLFHDMNKAAN